MRISSIVVPLIALLSGVGGYYLRLSELLNVFDPATGLPERNAAITFWLVVFSALNLFIIVLFAIFAAARNRSPRGFENAFGTDPVFYPIVFSLSGIVWLIGTYLYFDHHRAADTLQTMEIYFIILSAIAAICVTLFAIEMFQDSRRKAQYTLSIVPTIFLCFWLLLVYRINASNPILLGYLYQCLAIVASALSFYFTSGFLYDKPAPGKAIVSYYASIYFCAVTLADDHHPGLKLILGAIIAVSVVHMAMLLRNLRRKWPGEVDQGEVDIDKQA